MSAQAYRQRHKKIREGKLDPTILRQLAKETANASCVEQES